MQKGEEKQHELLISLITMACLASPEIGDFQKIVKPSEERVKELEEEVLNLFAQNEVLSLCISVCLPPFTHFLTPS